MSATSQGSTTRFRQVRSLTNTVGHKESDPRVYDVRFHLYIKCKRRQSNPALLASGRQVLLEDNDWEGHEGAGMVGECSSLDLGPGKTGVCSL